VSVLKRRPFVLIIRDGWGQNPDPKQNDTNAIYLARKPVDCGGTIPTSSSGPAGKPSACRTA